ncbi:hypothetical protein [Streptococcus uberis]|uniref:hypothetical protein n=1 Tax=Streptococcus uberis TaxID=1349 RepID=UPI0031BAD5DF
MVDRIKNLAVFGLFLNPDGTRSEITLRDGKNGQDGKDGVPGRDGVDGKDGAPGRDGRDGKDGMPGRDGKDGKEKMVTMAKTVCQDAMA